MHVLQALTDAVKIVESVAFPIDTNNKEQMLNVVNSCVATKFTHRFGTLMAVSDNVCVCVFVCMRVCLCTTNVAHACMHFECV
jgi:hypothetical protein